MKKFEIEFWDVVHRVAAGYPASSALSPTEQTAWGQKYADFLESLMFVVPDKELRDALFYVMTSSSPLGAREFRVINESRDPKKALSERVFKLRDAVDRKLGRTTNSRPSYAAMYAKYRSDAPQPVDKDEITGAKVLSGLIAANPESIDAFLRVRVPDYGTFSGAQKREIRAMYTADAGAYWWRELSKKYSTEPMSHRKRLVMAAFSRKFGRVTLSKILLKYSRAE